MPLWVNAANVVLVPSDHEGFGLAVLEALACDVPVVATPTGIHDVVLPGDRRARCARRTSATRWVAAVAPHLAAADPRVAGRARAELYGAQPMARRVLQAWRELLGEVPHAA